MMFRLDDAGLQRAFNTVPTNAIILIEDIDCAFPSREEDNVEEVYFAAFAGNRIRQPSKITFSGLLNTIDGVASEEGKLFFATVCLFHFFFCFRLLILFSIDKLR